MRQASWVVAAAAVALVLGGCASNEPPPPSSELQIRDNVIRPKSRTMYAIIAVNQEPGAGEIGRAAEILKSP